MSLFARFAPASGRVRVARVAALASVPRRTRRAEQCVDRGTLFIGWGGVP
jgi:hypothetical protein